jgi:hypothetical protein
MIVVGILLNFANRSQPIATELAVVLNPDENLENIET